MQIIPHQLTHLKVAELASDEVIIHSADEALDLLGDIYYQGYDSILIHQKNITPDFFDLKNRMAGDILQKFSNYRMRLMIIGDFEYFTSTSLHDFIRESNKGKTVNFVSSVEEAIDILRD